MARSSHAKTRTPFPSPTRAFVRAVWWRPVRVRGRIALDSLRGLIDADSLDDVAIHTPQARGSAKFRAW